jgi:hypothetical protein
MAVSTTDTFSGPYEANGVTVEFPFTFKAVSVDDVGVFIRDAGGDEVILDSSVYSVALAVEGGTVTMFAAPTSGDLYIFSEPSFLQPVSFASGQPFLPSVVNEVNDRDVVRALYLKREIDRSPKTPLGGGAESQYPVVKPDGSWGFSAGTGSDPALRTDLSQPGAGKGADIVRYRVTDDAVPGSLADKLQQTVSVKDFGAAGNGTADDTTAFEEAIDWVIQSPKTRKLIIPAVDVGYRLTRPLEITQSLQIEGEGWNPYSGYFGDRAVPGQGSWLLVDHPGLGVKGPTVTSSADAISGFSFRNIGFQRPFQPTPHGSSWTPIDNDFDLQLHSTDCIVENIMHLGTCRGIDVDRGNFGRFNGSNIFGHFFEIGIQMQRQYDLPMLRGFRAWPYWSLNNIVADHTVSNLKSLRLGRMDNPFFSDIFTIAHNVGMDIVQSESLGGEYPGGSVNKGKFSNIDLDLGQYGLRVRDDVGVCDLDFSGLSIQADNRAGVSHGMDIAGNSARVGIVNFDARFFRGNAIRCVTGTGNSVSMSGRVYVNGFSAEPDSEFPAFEFASGNGLRMAAWPIIEGNGGSASTYGGGGEFRLIEQFSGDLDALYDTVAEKAATADLANSASAARGAGQVGFNRNRPYTGNTIAAYAKQTILTISPLMAEFAGGAPMNGVDDAAAAMRACIAYAKTTTTRYDGTCVQIMLPNGKLRLDSAHPSFVDRALDITGCDHVSIHGLGMGNSTLALNGNFAALKGDDAAGTPLLGFTMKNLLILGPGRSNVNAHAIMMGGNNSCRIEDVRAWSCRTYLDYRDAWQLEVIRPRCDGQGGLACYDGLFGRDGTAGLAECVVDVQGGQIAYVERYGWRAQNPTGIKGFGTEILACGSIGVYWGDSPSGKAFKWVTYNDMIVDTCPDLVVLRAGSSTYVKENQIHFKWLGYASEPLPGEGIGLDVSGMKDSAFTVDKITNVQYGVKLSGCDGIVARLGQISDYDRLLTGGVAIICENTIGSAFDVGRTRKASSSPSTVAFVESGTSNNNRITGLFGGAVNTVGAGTDKTGAKVI